MTERRKIANALSNGLLIVAFLNGLAFFVVSTVLGGTAINGEVIGNEYFLGTGEELKPVSRQVFDYSLWHGISVLSLLVLAIVLTAVNQYHWQSKPAKPRRAYARASTYDYLVLISAALLSLAVVGAIIYSILG